MSWGASDAPEAAHERCKRQAAREKKLLVSRMVTCNDLTDPFFFKSRVPRRMFESDNYDDGGGGDGDGDGW